MNKINSEISIIQYLFSHPGLTRTEIADQLQIRKNSVGNACEALILKKLIWESRAQQPQKRETVPRRRRIHFNGGGASAGFDAHRAYEHESESGVQSHRAARGNVAEAKSLRRIRDCLHKAIESASVPYNKIVGLGFSDFIPHDIGTGLKTKSVWMPEWGDLNIRALLEEDLRFPRHHHALHRCLCARGKRVRGCKTESAFCVVQLDHGIGLSVFKNGTYLTGSDGHLR